MVRVGILGATGYTGLELVRLLSAHPQAKVKMIVSSTSAGEALTAQAPGLLGHCELALEAMDIAQIKARCDVVFTALPHGASGPAIRALHEAGVPLIDLSADLRYRDAEVYAAWYGVANAVADLLPSAVYGLPEVYREQIKDCDLIANPGCYTTCSILSLRPLLAAGLIEPSPIIIDAKSGVTGAGKKPSETTHFCETDGSFKAYGVTKHRHTSEIEQELSLAAGREILCSFTPHLLPVKRGILSTIYATPKAGAQEIGDCLCAAYANEPFVRVVETLPELKHVVGSNCLHIGFAYDARVGRLVLVSALDNLIKGASGQAIQNMNLRFDLPETAGLDMPAWTL